MTGAPPLPAFLVVDDDEAFARSLRRTLAPYGRASIANSVATARDLAGKESWCGVIADLDLGDDLGFAVIELVRQHDPAVPALILTGHAEPWFINRAFAMDAQYLCKSCDPEDVARFARRAIARGESNAGRLDAMVKQLTAEHGLTRAEAELVTFGLEWLPRAEIAARRAVSVNTVKSQIRAVLRKLGVASFDELRMRALGRPIRALDRR